MLWISYTMSNMQSTSTERLTIFIDPDLNIEVRIAAVKRRKSLSQFVSEALKEYLSKPTK
jgi:predicted HicB family RNase H-like nuclease